MPDDSDDTTDSEFRTAYEHADTTHPVNAPGKRPAVTPLLAVLGLIVLIAVVFLLITWVQQNT